MIRFERLSISSIKKTCFDRHGFANVSPSVFRYQIFICSHSAIEEYIFHIVQLKREHSLTLA
jgi:hypothetical protein